MIAQHNCFGAISNSAGVATDPGCNLIGWAMWRFGAILVPVVPQVQAAFWLAEPCEDLAPAGKMAPQSGLWVADELAVVCFKLLNGHVPVAEHAVADDIAGDSCWRSRTTGESQPYSDSPRYPTHRPCKLHEFAVLWTPLAVTIGLDASYQLCWTEPAIRNVAAHWGPRSVTGRYSDEFPPKPNWTVCVMEVYAHSCYYMMGTLTRHYYNMAAQYFGRSSSKPSSDWVYAWASEGDWQGSI